MGNRLQTWPEKNPPERVPGGSALPQGQQEDKVPIQLPLVGGLDQGLLDGLGEALELPLAAGEDLLIRRARVQEPGRLWRRYAYGLVKFSWLSLRALFGGYR